MMMIGDAIQLASLPRSPWKNGAGVTRNLAVHPEGAGFDDFLWRLSLAEVGESGKFSLFPGVDRVLLPWQGNGMLLQRKQEEAVKLSALFEPYAFAGEDEIEASLIDGPVVDFNVMVRRDRAVASIHRCQTDTLLGRGTQVAFFLCARGSFNLLFAEKVERCMEAGQALRASRLGGDARILPQLPDGELIVVLLDAQE